MERTIKIEQESHHKQQEFCLTRAKYRQGRKLTAVKVYTVNDESKFLIVAGVPTIKIGQEVEDLCQRYGHTEELRQVVEYPVEQFTETYMVKYASIKSARFAKKQLDGKSFYGGILHVFYAPELESVEDTRQKLQERRKAIAALTKYKQDPELLNSKKVKDPRSAKHRYLSRMDPQFAGKYTPERDSCGPSSVADIPCGASSPAIGPAIPKSQVNEKVSEDNIVEESVNGETVTSYTITMPQSSQSGLKRPLSNSVLGATRNVNVLGATRNEKKIKLFTDKKIIAYK